MKRLVEIATERRVTIIMFMVAIVLFGLVSLSRLSLNLLPDISYPTLTIRTELTGAAPVEIENLITKPIEESVGVIRNVRLVRSVSRSRNRTTTSRSAPSGCTPRSTSRSASRAGPPAACRWSTAAT